MRPRNGSGPVLGPRRQAGAHPAAPAVPAPAPHHAPGRREQARRQKVARKHVAANVAPAAARVPAPVLPHRELRLACSGNASPTHVKAGMFPDDTPELQVEGRPVGKSSRTTLFPSRHGSKQIAKVTRLSALFGLVRARNQAPCSRWLAAMRTPASIPCRTRTRRSITPGTGPSRSHVPACIAGVPTRKPAPAGSGHRQS